MKKMLMFAGLACAALSLLPAQNSGPPLYEADTLAGFREWQYNNSGEEKNFKIPVLFNSAGDIVLTFIDAALEEQLEFETEFPWPPMQSGQRVTIYFSARGPWVWDRELDAIDYGDGRLVQAQAGAPPIAAAPAESRTNVPVTNPSPAEIASSREDPADSGFDYGKQPVVTPPPPRQVIVQISGNPPQRGRYYRLQVGSFSVAGNAARAADSLREAGLSPAFEEFRDKVRVVLSHIPGENVVETARKIGSAGFSQVWCREEP
ncbi:MAG: SPOR domain-containing protein [Treponema sp.]|jgi:hypothetical protein|nr:SPOR domain-containing protein [Treponema sp.]